MERQRNLSVRIVAKLILPREAKYIHGVNVEADRAADSPP